MAGSSNGLPLSAFGLAVVMTVLMVGFDEGLVGDAADGFSLSMFIICTAAVDCSMCRSWV